MDKLVRIYVLVNNSSKNNWILKSPKYKIKKPFWQHYYKIIIFFNQRVLEIDQTFFSCGLMDFIIFEFDVFFWWIGCIRSHIYQCIARFILQIWHNQSPVKHKGLSNLGFVLPIDIFCCCFVLKALHIMFVLLHCLIYLSVWHMPTFYITFSFG